MSLEFKASKRTMLKALEAMKKAEYPKRQGEKAGERQKWEEHHQECMGRLMTMIMEGRYK